MNTINKSYNSFKIDSRLSYQSQNFNSSHLDFVKACEQLNITTISHYLSQGANPFHQVEIKILALLDLMEASTTKYFKTILDSYSQFQNKFNQDLLWQYATSTGQFNFDENATYKLPAGLLPILAADTSSIATILNSKISLSELMKQVYQENDPNDLDILENALSQAFSLLIQVASDEQFNELLDFGFNSFPDWDIDIHFFKILITLANFPAERLSRLIDIYFANYSNIIENFYDWSFSFNQFKQYLLSIAIQNNRFEAAVMLLQKYQANPNLTSGHAFDHERYFQDYPLVAAASEGKFTMFQLLLEHGADLSKVIKSDELSFICSLLKAGDEGFLNFMKTASLDLKKWMTSKPEDLVHAAAQSNSFKSLAFLQESGLEINKHFNPDKILFDVVLNKNPSVESLQYFVEHGANLYSPRGHGVGIWSSDYEKTILEFAAKTKSADALKYLLSVGFSSFNRDNRALISDLLSVPGDLPEMPNRDDVEQIIKVLNVLKEHGFDLTYYDQQNRSLLEMALSRNYPPFFIEFLITEGLDPNQLVDGLPLIYNITPIEPYRTQIKNILIRSSEDRDFAILQGQQFAISQGQLISEATQNTKKVSVFSKLQSLTEEQKEPLLEYLIKELTSASIDSAIDWQNNLGSYLELIATPPKFERSSV